MSLTMRIKNKEPVYQIGHIIKIKKTVLTDTYRFHRSGQTTLTDMNMKKHRRSLNKSLHFYMDQTHSYRQQILQRKFTKFHFAILEM